MKIHEKGIRPKSEAFFATPGARTKKLFYYVTCTGHYWYENTYCLRRDHYNSFLMMYVLKGKGKLWQPGQRESPFQKGELVLMDCYGPHGYSAGEDLETLWLHFDGLNSREIYEEICSGGARAVTPVDSYVVRTQLQEIFQMHKGGVRMDDGIQSAALSRIFAELLRTDSGAQRGQEPDLELCLAYIREHLQEEIRVKDLADCAALSEFHFSRWFKSRTGASPYEYITAMRVNEAKVCLKATDRPLAVVAGECGFASEGNFNRAFRRHTGVTPGAFRRMDL